jgi:hypothetical protein
MRTHPSLFMTALAPLAMVALVGGCGAGSPSGEGVGEGVSAVVGIGGDGSGGSGANGSGGDGSGSGSGGSGDGFTVQDTAIDLFFGTTTQAVYPNGATSDGRPHFQLLVPSWETENQEIVLDLDFNRVELFGNTDENEAALEQLRDSLEAGEGAVGLRFVDADDHGNPAFEISTGDGSGDSVGTDRQGGLDALFQPPSNLCGDAVFDAVALVSAGALVDVPVHVRGSLYGAPEVPPPVPLDPQTYQVQYQQRPVAPPVNPNACQKSTNGAGQIECASQSGVCEYVKSVNYWEVNCGGNISISITDPTGTISANCKVSFKRGPLTFTNGSCVVRSKWVRTGLFKGYWYYYCGCTAP